MQQLSMSIKEAREVTGICCTNLYAAIKSGSLKARKFGKKTLILKQDLEEFLTTLEMYQTKKSKEGE